MKSLYLSLLSSEHIMSEIYQQSQINPGYAGSKFNRLIIRGLKENGIDSQSLSSIPANSLCKRKFWIYKSEEENGVRYNYIPTVTIPFIKQAITTLYVFFYLIIWGAFRRKDRFVLMDVLNVSLCTSALLACKITRVKTVGVMTDMPGLMVASSSSFKNDKDESNKRRKESFNTRVNKTFLSKFDGYVFLTEQMNDTININHKPYIIMEGLVDSSIQIDSAPELFKGKAKSMLYAGGLHERYGLKMLVDAFRLIEEPDYKLVLYGSGPYVEKLKEQCSIDKRIEYRGVAPNFEVMKEELNTSVLVNPRFTTEEFTKYSFPSKNMEYMSTGRPLLTTKLPGMPQEYYEYVYLFEEESLEGYLNSIKMVLSKSDEELNSKGREAQEWILTNKNNIIQTKRIIELVNLIM